MLTQKELIQWFRLNGVDIGLPFPAPLIERLKSKAKSKDVGLFVFMEDFFITSGNDLILRFNSWKSCYSFYDCLIKSAEQTPS